MKPAFLRTVTGKTLLRLALAGAAVLLLASLLGTWLLYRQIEAQELQQLTSRVTERARVAERVLGHTVETHAAVLQAFAERWPKAQSAATDKRFEMLMARYPDGAWRNRKEVSDGRLFPTGWIHRDAALSADLRRRIVLFYDLSQIYGPGAAMRRDNLFFMGVPEDSNMGYDPYLNPNWIFDIDEKFSHFDFEWGRLGHTPAHPGTATRWSQPSVEVEIEPHFGALFTGVTPMHFEGRQLAAVGTTILLSEFLARVLPPATSDGRYLIFHPSGALLADTELGERLAPQVGKFKLADLPGDLPAALLAAAGGSGEGAAIARSGYSRVSDAYFALARIEGPGWQVAATLPGALLRQRALRPALWALGAGVGVLLTLLLIFASVLRRQVAAPLGELTRAAETLAAGDTSVRLPAWRDDELGRLAHAFNDMTQKVALRDAALREDKESIEAALTSLRLNEERWRAMTDNASDVIAVVDGAGVFTYVSPSVEKMLGADAASLLGQSAFDRVHPDDVPKLRPRLLLQLSGRATLFRARHVDGRWRTLEVVGSDLRQHPALAGLVLNIRDVSETVQAEEALVRQREALHQSEKLSALGGLLAGVAHELNNPLAVVVGRAIQLQSSAASAADRDTASKIRQAAERCARIVKTFLAMARKQAVERAPTDINGVIADAIDVLAYTLQSGGVAVDTRLASGLPPVLADADQLTQVFMNLFTNAQQAMAGQGGRRRLFVCTDAVPGESRLTVEVSDSGPGVAPDVAGRIFEPFFTTKPVGAGTGVGLSVSLGIVQAHGGTMQLDASHPGGARFVLSLPTLHGVARAPAPAPAGRPHGRPLRILVVDDEVEIAEILCEILGDAGHHVALAHGGEEALQRLADGGFDAVLTDLKMPGMDGPALYRQIELRYPQLARRVIAITGDTLGGEVQRFVQTSGVPVIDKPFDPDEIITRIDEVAAGLDAAPSNRA